MTIESFEAGMRTRVIFGPGAVSRIGEVVRGLGARRTLLVTDNGIVRAGHADRVECSLRQAGIDTASFAEVRENPTTEDVDRGMVVAREAQPDLLVALGGGSAMDCAKGINFLLTNGGAIRDYWGIGKATQPMLPSVAIPTTAGTGSEAQSFALISDPLTHQKMACGDTKVAFRVAILDPELTRSQPPRVTALTGIDALAHALETMVTRPRNPFSTLFSREAWRLLIQGFPRVLHDSEDLAARREMQLGAHWAGVAIEHSMLGAAHSLANPLTARCGVPHGQAVGVMLPHVIEYNARFAADPYRELIRMAVELGVLPAKADLAELITMVGDLLRQAGLATRLEDLGVSRECLPELASEAGQQWTARFNPGELTPPILRELYERAY